MQPVHKHVECPNPKGVIWRNLGFHKLHYYEWGDAGCGRTVICVHGLTRNARDFDFLACTLVEAGFHVICPDIAGRGRSEWLANPKWYGYPLYVANMMTLLTSLGLHNIHWVGTSMGGLIGMMLETGGPHIIDRMVLNDIGPFIPKESIARIGSYVGQDTVFPDMESAEKHFREIHSTFGITDEAHWQHMITHSFIRQEDGTVRAHYDPHIGDAFRTKSGKLRKLPDLDMWKMWDMIRTPVLVLRGEESDLLLRETAQRMAERNDVDLVEFPNVGHAPMLIDDKQIRVVVEWLQG